MGRLKAHDFKYFGIQNEEVDRLKQTLKAAVGSDVSATRIRTKTSSFQEKYDILTQDPSFGKDNCDLGLSKAHARDYRCAGDACKRFCERSLSDYMHTRFKILPKGSALFEDRVAQ